MRVKGTELREKGGSEGRAGAGPETWLMWLCSMSPPSGGRSEDPNSLGSLSRLCNEVEDELKESQTVREEWVEIYHHFCGRGRVSAHFSYFIMSRLIFWVFFFFWPTFLLFSTIFTTRLSTTWSGLVLHTSVDGECVCVCFVFFFIFYCLMFYLAIIVFIALFAFFTVMQFVSKFIAQFSFFLAT